MVRFKSYVLQAAFCTSLWFNYNALSYCLLQFYARQLFMRMLNNAFVKNRATLLFIIPIVDTSSRIVALSASVVMMGVCLSNRLITFNKWYIFAFAFSAI